MLTKLCTMILGATATRATKLPVNGMVCRTQDNAARSTRLSKCQGIPKIFASSKTLATEVVESKPHVIIFKLRQEYTPKGLHFSKAVNSLVTLTLDEDGKVKYHKDMWNEKDYSHEGLGKVMKTLNGDHLTKITQPPKGL